MKLPSVSFLIYLYWKLVPAGKLMVTNQSGLLLVYLEALNATALPVLQLPNCEIDPMMYTFSPYVVVACSLNVTATDVAVAQADVVVELVFVVVAVPEVVPVAGNTVSVAVAYGPVAEVATHVPGTLWALGSPHEAGTTELRRASAVRREAYDQVRSPAERGVPSSRENCSARDPLDGVYFCTTAT